MPLKVTASCSFHGQELTGLEVVNPGGWFGRTWLIEMGGSYTSRFLIVEADCYSDAIDELSDSKYDHEIHVPDEDLGDYPEADRRHDGSGRVIDTDHVMAYGPDGGHEAGFPCLYHVEGYPVPVTPKVFSDYDFEEVMRIREECEDQTTGPGKYEGEPIYVPHMWENCWMDGENFEAEPDDFDRVCFPELEGKGKVVMFEREDGSVLEV